MDFSMKGKVESSGGAGIINKFIGTGMACKFEPASDHPFIKAFKPA